MCWFGSEANKPRPYPGGSAGDPGAKLQFPKRLTSEQRAAFHRLAPGHGLLGYSEGLDADRFLVLYGKKSTECKENQRAIPILVNREATRIFRRCQSAGGK